MSCGVLAMRPRTLHTAASVVVNLQKIPYRPLRRLRLALWLWRLARKKRLSRQSLCDAASAVRALSAADSDTQRTPSAIPTRRR